MKYRWVQIDGKLVPADEASERSDGPFVQGQMAPFVSMVDGKTYTSRTQYEREVRARGYEVVGNEVQTLMQQRGPVDPDADGRKDLIRHQIMEMGHEGFKKALQRDVDFVKWNSRGLPR